MSARSRTGVCSRLFIHLTEGPYRWGRLIVSPSRYGVAHYTLRLYPPGVDREGRIRLRVAEAWPAAAVAIFLSVIAADPVPGSAIGTTAVATAACGAGWLGMRRLTRRVRAGVLVLHGVTGLGRSGCGRLEHIEVSFGKMIDADAALAAGRITPVDYEVIWAAVYGDASTEDRRQAA